MAARLALLAALAALAVGCSGPPPPDVPPDGQRFGLTAGRYLFVETESKPGGRLDFIAVLPEDEHNFAFAEVVYKRDGMALVMWGQAMRQLGMTSATDAVGLYERLRDEPLEDHLERALTNGFNADLDQEEE